MIGKSRRLFSPYFFTFPAVLLLLLLLIIPSALVFVLSFTDYMLGNTEIQWIGMENYLQVLSNADFWQAFLHTLRYTLIVVVSSIVLSLAIATNVYTLRSGREFYEILFFLPATSTFIAMAIVWKYLLHGNIGPFNQLLIYFGIQPIDFFGNPSLVLLSLSIIGIWQLTGFNMVIFISGLTTIPKDIYSAAELDGITGGPTRFFRITLPLLSPTFLFVLITSTITCFKVFDTIAVLTRGGPQNSSDVVLYLIYREAFQSFNTGFASAMTVFFLLFILLLSWVQHKFVHNKVYG